MSFWSQVVKGKTKNIVSIDIINDRLLYELQDLIVPMKNGSIFYGGDKVTIYSSKHEKTGNRVKSLLAVDFVHHGENGEFCYRNVFEETIFKIEVSRHGEKAWFTMLDTSGNVGVALELILV